MSILTGSHEPSSARRMPTPPAPAPKPEPVEVLKETLDGMRGSLDYLRLDPEERARRAAAELLEQERARHASELAAERAQRSSELARAEGERENLRRLLNEADAGAEELRAELKVRNAEVRRIQEEAAAIADAHRQAVGEIETLRNRPAPPPVLQAPAPALRLAPEDITIEWHKNPVTGLLASAVLKAKGYDDLVLEVHRGGDNSIRHLKPKGGTK